MKEAQESNIWEFLLYGNKKSVREKMQEKVLQDELIHYSTLLVANYKMTALILYCHHQGYSLYNSIPPIANKYFCIVGISVQCESSCLDLERLNNLFFM